MRMLKRLFLKKKNYTIVAENLATGQSKTWFVSGYDLKDAQHNCFDASFGELGYKLVDIIDGRLTYYREETNTELTICRLLC